MISTIYIIAYLVVGVLVTRLIDYISTKTKYVEGVDGVRGMLTIMWPFAIIGLILMYSIGKLSLSDNINKLWKKIFGIKD